MEEAKVWLSRKKRGRKRVAGKKRTGEKGQVSGGGLYIAALAWGGNVSLIRGRGGSGKTYDIEEKFESWTQALSH